MGYVGLSLTLRLFKAGLSATGFDIASAKADTIARRRRDLAHKPHARVANAVDRGFSVTTDIAQIAHCDVVIICVPTPLSSHQ